MRQRTHSLLFIEMKPNVSFHCSSDANRTNFAKMYLVSRTETFAKLFFLVSVSGLFMYVALAFYSFHTAYSTVAQMQGYRSAIDAEKFRDDLKYILLWTTEKNTFEIQEGQGILLDHDCKNVNCYITTNKSLLNGGYDEFNAIVFHFGLLRQWLPRYLPKYRSRYQKYVFYSRLPSDDFPICSLTVNNYFNWTWSYKFGSDIFNPFIEVRHINGTVVAPKPEVNWPENSKSSTSVYNSIDEVNTKLKAVIWLMNNCELKTTNLISLKKLSTALKDHDLSLDIYGCGKNPCPLDGCLSAISRHYYFYLVIESSVTEDYLTEEVLLAYDNDAVPIVVGGVDYTK